MTPLLIFPFNGNGLEALDCLDGRYRFAGFVDDTPAKQGKNRFGHDVWGREALQRISEASVLAVPGGPRSYRNRHVVIDGLAVPSARLATVIHPSASVSPRASIGRNVLIMAGVVITSNAVIGDHVCVLPNSVIHHDSVVGTYALIGSNVTIAGGVTIEESCYIGSGSSVIHGITIGRGALVGLGSNVVKDVPDGITVAGNPARTLAPRRVS